MAKHKVAVFRPFQFEIGQKIRIDGGPRNGDWEVAGVSDKKVKLRCPISGREFEWALFCYLAETLDEAQWPAEE